MRPYYIYNRNHIRIRRHFYIDSAHTAVFATTLATDICQVKSKSKIFYYNTRKMYIDESIRLKPIRAYLSFISIMSLYNNDLCLVEQVSKSAGTQRTCHTMKENHCYVKNSVLPTSRRSNLHTRDPEMYTGITQKSFANKYHKLNNLKVVWIRLSK